MEKIEFNLGDTAYSIDSDYNSFEEQIRRVELESSGTITYSTWDFDFTKEDIGTLVFKTELDREIYLECKVGI